MLNCDETDVRDLKDVTLAVLRQLLIATDSHRRFNLAQSSTDG